MGKQLGKLGSLGLDEKPVYEKEMSEFKPFIFRLKIDLELYPAHGGGIEQIYIHGYFI